MEEVRMGERITIYAGPPLARAIEATLDDDNRSGRVNNVAERYLDIVEAVRPRFTRDEWCAVCDALNGVWLNDSVSARLVWANVADTPELGEKWSIDQPALTSRLRALDAAGNWAVIETVQRFWARAHLDTDDALRAAGAIE